MDHLLKHTDKKTYAYFTTMNKKNHTNPTLV